jgi:hypothetical protein
MTRNIFFDLCDDEPALPIAPVRTIAITDAIRREDSAKQAARRVKITWQFRPTPKIPKPPTQKKTHCPHGHRWTKDNIYIESTGVKRCRTCRHESQRASMRKRRAAAQETAQKKAREA